jgi:hypothetical protein
MTGRDAIELVVEKACREARLACGDFGYLIARYADALQAEAALPDRRPEWVAWARPRAIALRKVQKKLGYLLAEPYIPEP